jgi:NAD(P)H-hydrate epimerase
VTSARARGKGAGEGHPAPAERELDEGLAAALLPPRDPEGHKGTFGRLLVVAGSTEYAGAALMAGSAALRAGAGLVTLCLPASLQPHLAGRVPELITLGLPETSPGQLDAQPAAALIAEQPHDAALVGPGLRPGVATRRLVERILREEGPPLTLDAGALDALSGLPGWWRRLRRETVLTPHPGEFARLLEGAGGATGASGAGGAGAAAASPVARSESAAAAARRWGHVVVLKGPRTVVAAPDGSVVVAPFVLPALATAGTGDVLAGIVASLLAQGVRAADAACLGVFLHGRAGEHVSERLGDAGLLATDLLAEIPRVRRHLTLQRQRERGGSVGFRSPRADPAGA